MPEERPNILLAMSDQHSKHVLVREGRVDDTICNLMDLGPTMVAAAGADPMPAVDGRSLWGNLNGEIDPERIPETFSEHLGAVGARHEDALPVPRDAEDVELR